MSKKLRLFTAFIAVMLCFSVCMLSVYAVEESGIDSSSSEVSGGIDESSGTDVSGEESSGGESSDVESGGSESEPDYEDPTDSGYDSPSDTNEGGDDYNQDTNQQSPDNDTPDYSNEDTESLYSSNDNEFYVGGGQTYVVPENTAPSVPLYDTDNSMYDKELSSSDWGDIAANLKNASQSDDDDDFNFIKKNTSTSDNGDWMLIAGIICLLLSIAGIVYVVVSTVKNKKGAPSAAKYGSKYAAATASRGGYRSGRDYGDSFRTPSKTELKRRSKYDTAEVKIPRNSRNMRYKK